MSELVYNWEERFNELGKRKKAFFFIIDYDTSKAIISDNFLSEQNILFDINGNSNLLMIDEQKDKEYNFKKYPISFKEYEQLFNNVMKDILYGNTFLANLTCSTTIETDLNLKDIFIRAKAKYKVFLKDEFVCFSPEKFIQIMDNYIYTYPMKGTIDASVPGAKYHILNDEKEMAEHCTIVDLLRNDLSIVSNNVAVEQFRYLEKLNTNQKNLIQVSSKIKGKLYHKWHDHLGSILKKMLPAGSICGAPKKKTVEIINKAEIEPRYWYTGICGFYNGNQLDTGVMIRFIENRNGKKIFRSGGGITFLSDAKTEYQEMIDKVYLPF